MKNILIIVSLILPLHAIKAQLRCLSTPQYYKIANGSAPMKVNKGAIACFSNKYFSFYTPETGTRTISIEGNTIDTLNGFARQRFINGESLTNMRGDYSIEISYERTKTVIISFTRFGEAYIIEAPAFLGSMEDASIGNTTWSKEISGVKAPATEQKKPAKLEQYLNPVDPAKLSQQILSRINTNSQLIATFMVRFDSAGRLNSIIPEHPLPDTYAKDIQTIMQAAIGLEIPPYSKDGVNYPSYTYVRIALH